MELVVMADSKSAARDGVSVRARLRVPTIVNVRHRVYHPERGSRSIREFTTKHGDRDCSWSGHRTCNADSSRVRSHGISTKYSALAQPGRAGAFEALGRWFESNTRRHTMVIVA